MIDESELDQRIRERAFQIWIDEGQPLGRDKAHWERARREIAEIDGASRRDETPAPTEPIGEIKYAKGGLVDQGEGQPPAERES